MQAVAVLLVLIDVAIILGPIAVVAVTYQNNWEGLIVPPELNKILNNNILTNNVLNNSTVNGTSIEDQLQVTQPVVTEFNLTERTVALSFNFTNPFSFDMTLQALSGNVECKEHKFLLGNASLNGAVKVMASQTTQVTALCKWTQDAEKHFQSAHPNATEIDAELVNVKVNLNGLTIELSEPIQIPNVPIK